MGRAPNGGSGPSRSSPACSDGRAHALATAPPPLAPIPSTGDAFTLLKFGAAVGGFDTVSLPPLAAGLSWDTADLLTSGVETVLCAADTNRDGVANTRDFLDYLNLRVVQEPEADLNGDGEVNTLAFLAYLQLWAQPRL